MTNELADEIEREARRLLRDRIERLPWYPRLSSSEREAAIQADVDRYWRIMQPDAIRASRENPGPRRKAA